MRVAERQIEVERTNLDNTVVRAPFSGIAVSKDAQPGEMVSPNSAGGGFTRTGICTLVDMRSLEIEVDVNESYINRVQDSQPVTAVLNAYPDWQIPAHVITTVPKADRQKATVLVRIGFAALDPRILPDMGVKVTFLKEADAAATASARPVTLVPKAAIRTENDQSYAFVVGQQRRRSPGRQGRRRRRRSARGRGGSELRRARGRLAAADARDRDGSCDQGRSKAGGPSRAGGRDGREDRRHANARRAERRAGENPEHARPEVASPD